ncbi:c-type cytochrome [Methylomonas sp. MED-D]|uniref:Cytochrome C n=1 Tax=Methylomonas koyamae TaxID=702114 RepID=A0A177N7E7_9GAMM|nr:MULTISPECIES: c-type cytochrome [Methylomonas]MDT4332422.1 c-type cytochrome [Methylomonas sp. MV1]OAI13946.1 cytochrome C [Methylomonas koyamae]WGS85408.1 c-type cytochrome [Methylomonas sp. UP202]
MRAKISLILLGGLIAAGPGQATSLYVGQNKAGAVCAQCHGIRMPSADAPFPPLGGRDPEYLKTAIKQYRDKTRKSDIMNAIAGSLTDSEINDIAAYYGSVKP